MANKTDHNKCKMIVSKLVSQTRWDGSKNPISWPKEIKIAKQLIKKFPQEKFWKTLFIEEKPTSLSWFLTTEGNIILCQHNLKTNKKETTGLAKIAEVKMNSTKLGEDKNVSLPPTNIMEFMKDD
tara:strand:- start:530 stop:904 length:375 start_codon:yes stop_codon:yes gene_type:complete